MFDIIMSEGGKGMRKYNVLVVDDDKEIVRSIELFLKADGYEVIKAYNGLEAIDAVMENEIHLIILDIMMPELNGVETLIKIRTTKNIPVILLSAKSEDCDKILGLTAGADDYVTKPFNPSELMARVKSQIRRYTMLGGMKEEDNIIKIGTMTVDTDKKTVTVDGEAIKLTKLEYKIVELLAKNEGKVFSVDEIYRIVWKDDTIVSDNAVAVHIRHIREKIEINPKEPKFLKVVWGIGYKISLD